MITELGGVGNKTVLSCFLVLIFSNFVLIF